MRVGDMGAPDAVFRLKISEHEPTVMTVQRRAVEPAKFGVKVC